VSLNDPSDDLQEYKKSLLRFPSAEYIKWVQMKRDVSSRPTWDNCGLPRIVALYTDIGRGHPSYLDSLLYLLKQKYPDLISTTVFDESRGLSLLGWKFVAWLYGISGKGGIQTRFYNLVRKRSQGGSQDSLFLRILRRDLRRSFRGFDGVCLVGHPIVARALADVCRVWYVHGEIAAPAECAVKGVEKILVPLEETKEKLVSLGADEKSVLVCGLMIEPGLVDGAEEAFRKRVERIQSDKPLTVGFFTSGAYPKEHMEKIVLGVRSVLQSKMKAVVFCGTNPEKYTWIKAQLKDVSAQVVEDKGEDRSEDDRFDLKLVARSVRQEDTQRAVELIPGLDVFVAASHERTNYAVGLGLPLFVLFPLIGTFATQNFEFASRHDAAWPLESGQKARELGRHLAGLRQMGELLQMAQNGHARVHIEGSYCAATHLCNAFTN
jgi:hypothetical protein